MAIAIYLGSMLLVLAYMGIHHWVRKPKRKRTPKPVPPPSRHELMTQAGENYERDLQTLRPLLTPAEYEHMKQERRRRFLNDLEDLM